MKKEFENIFKKIKHEDKDFSSHKRDWKNFEQNNESIALNALFSSKDSTKPHSKKEIELAYTSKYNYKHKKQVILLMITDKIIAGIILQ